VTGKVNGYGVIFGLSGIDDNALAISASNFSVKMVQGGGVKSYNKAYKISSSAIEVQGSYVAVDGVSVDDCRISGKVQYCKSVSNCFITNSNGHGCENCDKVVGNNISSTNSGIYSWGGGENHLYSDNIIFADTKGIYLQPNTSNNAFSKNIISNNILKKWHQGNNLNTAAIDVYASNNSLIAGNIYYSHSADSDSTYGYKHQIVYQDNKGIVTANNINISI
jgi:parallel beta-helix repeat protein